MDEKEFLELIGIGQERRNLEFKQSTPGNDARFKAKIAKAILGFTNIRDGGYIVIGLEKQNDGLHKSVGVQPKHLATYNGDNVASHIARYAEPYVKFDLEVVNFKGESYVVVRIYEFEDTPVICKKDYPQILRKGAIYTRSYRMPETVEVPSQTEMREILEITTEKRVKKFFQTMGRIGIIFSHVVSESDEEKFKSQRGDLISDE